MATNNTPQQDEYEVALGEYTSGLEAMRKGDYPGAATIFDGILGKYPDEPVLTERSQVYSRICKQKQQPAPAEPSTPEECYHRAVMLVNDGEADQAIRMLDHALQSEPNSPKILYARASAWALKGNAEAAVGDLRQAIGQDPKVRFQAVNDPDFEEIREEPAFIDIIEPTPSGA